MNSHNETPATKSATNMTPPCTPAKVGIVVRLQFGQAVDRCELLHSESDAHEQVHTRQAHIDDLQLIIHNLRSEIALCRKGLRRRCLAPDSRVTIAEHLVVLRKELGVQWRELNLNLWDWARVVAYWKLKRVRLAMFNAEQYGESELSEIYEPSDFTASSGESIWSEYDGGEDDHGPPYLPYFHGLIYDHGEIDECNESQWGPNWGPHFGGGLASGN